MRIVTPYIALALAATLAGCGAGSSGSSVSISTAVKSSTAKLSTVPTGSGTVKLDSLYLVVKELELKKAPAVAGPTGPTGPTGPSGTTGPTGPSSHHDVQEIEAGPYVLEINVADTNLQTAIPATIVPPGDYKGIEFEIHRVRNTDKLNLQVTRGMTRLDGLSIVLEGTCTGPATGTPPVTPAPTPFAVTSAMEVEVEYESPFSIAPGASSNVTLAFDASTWLKGPNGTTLDPCLNDPSVNGKIIANVKASLKAFGDDDRDGKDD
jgi:hypothetical protein